MISASVKAKGIVSNIIPYISSCRKIYRRMGGKGEVHLFVICPQSHARGMNKQIVCS